MASDRDDLPKNPVWAAIGLLQQQIENIELASKAARGSGTAAGDVSGNKKELHLSDANGQNLGTLVYADVYSPMHTYRTYLSGIGVIAEFKWDTESDKVIVAGDSPIAFAEAECRGPAYLPNQITPATNRLYRLGGEIPRYFKLQDGESKGSYPVLSFWDGKKCSDAGEPKTEESFGLEEIILPFSEPVQPPL